MELKDNRAALLLEVSDEGEITVEVAVNGSKCTDKNVAAEICRVMAMKLVGDEQFQNEIMASIENQSRNE